MRYQYLRYQKFPVALFVEENYFFVYHISLVIRRSIFSFQNNPKDLDLSSKMDLQRWDRLGRVKLVLLQNFIVLI